MRGTLYEIMLAVYILAFSLGVVAVIVSLLAHQRFNNHTFVIAALLFLAALFLVVADFLRLRSLEIPGLFEKSLAFVTLALTSIGNGLLGYSLLNLAFRLVERGPPAPIVVVPSVVALAALGALDDALPGPITAITNQAGLTVLQGFAIALVARGFERVGSVPLKPLVRQGLAACSVMVVLSLGQRVWQAFPGSPEILQEYPVTDLAYCLLAAALLMLGAFRYLFKPEPGGAGPAREIIDQYGISPRELEIISLISQGYSNRMVGAKLFISTMTVKNHIYHIYKKTGARNKVQLLRLLRTPK